MTAIVNNDMQKWPDLRSNKMGYCLEEFFEDVILPSKSLEDLKVNLGRMPREDYLIQKNKKKTNKTKEGAK